MVNAGEVEERMGVPVKWVQSFNFGKKAEKVLEMNSCKQWECGKCH